MELLHWGGTSTIRRTLTGTFWALTALDSEAFAAVPRHAESTVVVADASGFTEVGLGDVVAASVAGGCGGRLYINAYRRGADSDVRLAELDLRAGHTRELHWSAEGTLGVRVDGPWLVSTTVADAGRALVRRVDRPSPTSMTHDGRVANLTTLDGELMVCAVDTSGTRMLVGVHRGISDECWIVDISTGEAARLSGDDAGFGTFAFFDGEDAVWMESTPSGGPVLRRAEGALVREEPLVDAVVATPSLSWPCHVDTRTVRTADDQHDVEAIVLTPAPWDEQHVVVALHGGPRSRWTRKYNQLHQTLVWAGVRVVAPNTRGSSSYDRSFERSLRGRWGDVDQSDLVEVVRAVRADTPQATVVLMGVSYGAYQAFQAVISDPQLADGVVIAAGFIAPERLVAEGPERTRSSLVSQCAVPSTWARGRAAASCEGLDAWVVHGEADDIIPVGFGREVHAHLCDLDAHARLTIVPRAGHAVFDASPALHAELLDFVRSVHETRRIAPESAGGQA